MYKHTRRPMEQNKYLGKKEMQWKPIEFQKLQTHTVKKGQSSLSCTEKTGCPHTEQWHWNVISLYIKKLNSKWSKDLNIKPKIIQLLEVITREISSLCENKLWLMESDTTGAEEATTQQKEMLCMLCTWWEKFISNTCKESKDSVARAEITWSSDGQKHEEISACQETK